MIIVNIDIFLFVLMISLMFCYDVSFFPPFLSALASPAAATAYNADSA
jgi:hypothetical protein